MINVIAGHLPGYFAFLVLLQANGALSPWNRFIVLWLITGVWSTCLGNFLHWQVVHHFFGRRGRQFAPQKLVEHVKVAQQADEVQIVVGAFSLTQRGPTHLLKIVCHSRTTVFTWVMTNKILGYTILTAV